jgi:hypothetical protein
VRVVFVTVLYSTNDGLPVCLPILCVYACTHLNHSTQNRPTVRSSPPYCCVHNGSTGVLSCRVCAACWTGRTIVCRHTRHPWVCRDTQLVIVHQQLPIHMQTTTHMQPTTHRLCAYSQLSEKNWNWDV